MTTSVTWNEAGLELVADGVRAVADDLTLTAWGERHTLALGGLAAGEVTRSQSHDELGPHELLSFGYTTRSVRNPVAFRLMARCYDLEPVILLELVPGFDQPILGTEECASLRLRTLSACRRAVYLHQRVNEYGRDAVGSWWAQALCLADAARDNPWDWGLGLVWETGDRHAALLPMRAGGAVSRLRGEGQGLSLVASGWCGKHRYPRLPLGLLAVDDSPAGALDRGYRAVSALCEWSFRRREDKPVPEAFEFLGYSTWPGHGRKVTGQRVVEAVSALREQGVPVRWVWLEEGWQQVNRHQQLGGWGAEPQRFPGGLEATVRELQGRGGVRHVGVWLALQGG
ncbi:MAG: hypothetical protein HUU35_08155, partial [Armatimonadetes bacterium]|nr:hypothetical protein [Armatimonadota bacterium]